MRFFDFKTGPEKDNKDLDLFEYPASQQWRVPPPRRSLLSRMALAAIPVVAGTVLLILFADIPVAQIAGGIGQMLSPLIRLLLFIASGTFIFPSLIITYILHQFIFVNRMIARHMLFVLLAVAASFMTSYVLNLLLSGIVPKGTFSGTLQGYNAFPEQLEDGLFPALPTVLMTALTTAFYLLYPRFRLVCLSAAVAVAAACVVGGVYHLSGVFLGVYLAFLVTLLSKQGFETWMGRL